MVKLEEFMEIYQMKQVGHSISSISRATGLDRKTVRKYLSHDKNQPPTMKVRKPKASILQPFIEEIVNLQNGSDEFPPCPVIYEKLVEKGYTGSLSLIQKWTKNYRQTHFKNVVVRYETPPGKQAQVDWGEKRMKDTTTGQSKKVHIFCMTLSYSRIRFVHFTPKADMYYFLLCHKLAFDYFGGIPEEILYDQNRCVLTRPGIKDIIFNSRFLDFAHHYGFMPRVCKPYRPQTKGKVENSVKFVKRNFLIVQDSNQCNVLNQRKLKWMQKVNSKVHSTTQEIPFKRLTKENLAPLAGIPDYNIYYLETRKVFTDSTFSFHSQRYSVPPEYIGKRVSIKYKPNRARIDVFYKEKPVTQHRTDTLEAYVIKRLHRHMLWKIWRDDKKLFYKKEPQTENHPLKLYEEISDMEVNHATAHA